MSERSAKAWIDHARAQRRAWLRLSYRERLAWLEQAKRFASLVREARRRRAVTPKGAGS